MTDYKMLLAEAEEWADGCAEGGLKGNRREMDMANMFTLLGNAVEALVLDRDEALKALGESRARFGDMEQRALAAEARIEQVRREHGCSSLVESPGFPYPIVVEQCDGCHYPVPCPTAEIVAAASSGLVEDMRRNTAAQALEHAADAFDSDVSLYARIEELALASQGRDSDGIQDIGAAWLRERAATIREGKA